MLESLRDAAAVQKRKFGQKLLHSPLHPLYLKLAGSPQVREYRRFATALARNTPPPQWFAGQMARWTYRPRISILMAVRNSKSEWFRAAVDSVLAQIYPDWQLCIVDDASGSPVRPPPDLRICFDRLESRSGISAALNRALEMAKGDYITVVDHDDFLSTDALYRIVEALQQRRYQVLYSDEDYVDEKGGPLRPNFKPDWSPELLANCMYVGHLVVADRELMRHAGGFRSQFDGAQDYDLALRLTDAPVPVAHLPYILYHWRSHGQSIAQSSGAKPWANEAGRLAVEDMIRRRGWDARVMPAEMPTRYHVAWNLPRRERASIVVARKSGRSFDRFCAGVRGGTDYEDVEFVENAQAATGAYLVFLHHDLYPREPGWLAELLSVAQRPEVGVVGAKLVYPNGAIQHSGTVLGMGNDLGHPGRGLFQSDYWRWLDYTRNVMAVSDACLVTRRDVFESIGGLDSAFGSELAAADFCLRVRNAGFEVILNQRACLIHEERERERPAPQELQLFRKKWRGVLAKPDPYYSRYLRLDREGTALRMPTDTASDGSSLER